MILGLKYLAIEGSRKNGAVLVVLKKLSVKCRFLAELNRPPIIKSIKKYIFSLDFGLKISDG